MLLEKVPVEMKAAVEVAAQGDTPCSSLPASGVSAGCPPCSPPEKHKSDYRLVFPR